MVGGPAVPSAPRFPWLPDESTLTSSVCAVQPGTATPFDRQRSRTKTSLQVMLQVVGGFVSVVEALTNVTNRPSAEMPPLWTAPASAAPPLAATLRISLWGVQPGTVVPFE